MCGDLLLMAARRPFGDLAAAKTAVAGGVVNARDKYATRTEHK